MTEQTLNIISVRCVWNTFPVTCLVGGMYLIGASGKISRIICAWASSMRNPPSTVGSISKAWPSPMSWAGSPDLYANSSLMKSLANTVCAFSTASAVVR